MRAQYREVASFQGTQGTWSDTIGLQQARVIDIPSLKGW
jgi:hypothetical protein